MIYPVKASIRKAAPKTVSGGAGRGRYLVTCICGRTNLFDAFSWAGHRACRCKGCWRFIFQDGTVADSKSEL